MLKEYLQKNNISVYKLSKKSDVPYSTLNDLVNLKLPVENIRAGQLKSIADALDVEMDELYNLCIYCIWRCAYKTEIILYSFLPIWEKIY